MRVACARRQRPGIGTQKANTSLATPKQPFSEAGEPHAGPALMP